jgi:hypothetical protein
VRVDVIYRFFELFDLKNVAKVELMQYAARKGHVVVTPPFKACLEEKMLFAMYHHPVRNAAPTYSICRAVCAVAVIADAGWCWLLLLSQ